MSLDNYLMKIKVPSSAFFIKNMRSKEETGHLGKLGVSLSLSLSLSESIKYSEKHKIAKLLPVPAEFMPAPAEPSA